MYLLLVLGCGPCWGPTSGSPFESQVVCRRKAELALALVFEAADPIPYLAKSVDLVTFLHRQVSRISSLKLFNYSVDLELTCFSKLRDIAGIHLEGVWQRLRKC